MTISLEPLKKHQKCTETTTCLSGISEERTTYLSCIHAQTGIKKCHKMHGKDDTSVRYRWRKDDTSVVYSAQIGDNLVMPYTITSIRLLKEYTITVKIKFFLFQTAPETESVL